VAKNRRIQTSNCRNQEWTVPIGGVGFGGKSANFAKLSCLERGLSPLISYQINNIVLNKSVKFAIDLARKSLIKWPHQGENSNEAF